MDCDDSALLLFKVTTTKTMSKSTPKKKNPPRPKKRSPTKVPQSGTKGTAKAATKAGGWAMGRGSPKKGGISLPVDLIVQNSPVSQVL